MILEGRTSDAIEKTSELFPTLLNDKNLLFVLKVRQFIEMVNGTESEIRHTSTSDLPSTSSQTPITTNNLLMNSKTRSNSPSSSANPTTSGRSSSPMKKTNTSSRSRSNSPYTSGRTTTTSGAQHSNGTVNSSSRQSSANTTNELSQGLLNHSSLKIEPLFVYTETNKEQTTTVNSLSSNTVVNLMDIDDNPHGNNTANGFSNHGTVTHSSSSSSSTTNQISNGHSLLDDDSNNLVIDRPSNSNGCTKKSSDILDGMEYDGSTDTSQTTDMETTISSDVQKKSMTKEDDQLLIRILQFGRELHALKQQLTAEHGDNQQNDKMLQVNIQLKHLAKRPEFSLHIGRRKIRLIFLLGCLQFISLFRS